jgi:branched-subunit amino acid transport protein
MNIALTLPGKVSQAPEDGFPIIGKYGLGNARLVAIVVAWRTQNMIWTVGVGMVALWVLQAVDWTILNEWSNLSLWLIS